MIRAVRRSFSVAAAFAAMVPKLFLAYSIWVWMEFFVQILAMTIFYYFWRAVYSNTATIGGLTLQQTLNYILLAQILLPVLAIRVLFDIARLINDGAVGIELLRPVDFQGRFYIENLSSLFVALLIKLPLFPIAWYFFGLQIPSDPRVWAAFGVSLVLGHAVLFCFEWLFACVAFYTTETWGLHTAREGVMMFFSGALVPLAMLPAWLQSIAAALPFAQGLAMPVSLLSGITPLEAAPRIWLVQLAWLAGLGLLSRLVFNFAVRKVTVQGG